MPVRVARFVCALALVLGASPARQAGAAELQLAEGALCTSVDELSFRVSRAIAQPFEQVSGPHFAVDIRQDSQGFHARLEISSGGSGGGATASRSAQRLLNGASCDQITDALALAMALAIGSRAETPAASVPPASEPALPSPGQPSPQPDAVSPTEAAKQGPPGPRLGLELSALADSGSLPGAGLGAALGVRLGWPVLELRAQGLLLPERHAQIDEANAASPGADLGLVAGALLACTPLSGAKLIDVAACAGAELGRLSGRGTRVPTPHEQQRLWAAARLDLAGRWPLPGVPLGLELVVSLVAPLLRDEFVLKDIGTVHQPPNVAGRAALGLNWQFE